MKSRSPWLIVLAITGAWHVGRGAYGDGAVFIAAAVLLEADHRGVHKLFHRPIEVTRVVLMSTVALAVLLFTFAPRYSLIDVIVIYLVGLFVFLVTWHSDSRQRPEVTRPMHRATYLWSALLVGLSLFELGAYILATMNGGDDKNFPTITVLLDPALEGHLGRALFAVLWLAAGIKLMKPRIKSGAA